MCALNLRASFLPVFLYYQVYMRIMCLTLDEMVQPCCPLPIPFTDTCQWMKWIAQVLMHKSSSVTVILSSFIPLLNSLMCSICLDSFSILTSSSILQALHCDGKVRKLCVNLYIWVSHTRRHIIHCLPCTRVFRVICTCSSPVHHFSLWYTSMVCTTGHLYAPTL